MSTKSKAVATRHEKFIDEYVNCLNGTAAYLAVYPKSTRRAARASAAELLANPSISAEVNEKLASRGMSSDEVLARLTAHARGDMGDFLVLDDGSPHIDLQKAAELSQLGLIKEIVQTEKVIKSAADDDAEIVLNRKVTIKLYDAQAALDKLAKYHQLFQERSAQINYNVDVSALSDEELQRIIDGD